MKKPTLLVCVCAIVAVIVVGFALSIVLKSSPPKIPVFPYIVEEDTESTSSNENPWWPDGWSAKLHHGLMNPIYVKSWYQVTLEDLGWAIEVDNFDAYPSTTENVININTLLVATNNRWATLVTALGWYVPNAGGLGESVIIVAQGPTKGLSHLLSKFGELTPESF